MNKWSKDHNLIKSLVSNNLLTDLVRLIEESDCQDNLGDDTDIDEALINLNQYIKEITG